MEIGPLEYVVIGFQEHHFTDEILPALNAIQQRGVSASQCGTGSREGGKPCLEADLAEVSAAGLAEALV